MNSPASDSEDRLARAIDLHHEYLAAGGTGDKAALLRAHPDLAEILEPLLEDHDDHLASDSDSEIDELGDYRIIREIGRGGMGVVFEAEQLSIGRRVALKVLPANEFLDPRAVARFRREARLAGSLDHPGIAKVFAVGKQDGQDCFAMELVRGRSLAEIVDELRAIGANAVSPADVSALLDAAVGKETASDSNSAARPGVTSYVDWVLEWGVQLADALDHAHVAGIVHRDVKPANILIRTSGSAVLTDFGIARSDAAMSVTLTGAFAGTPSYSSPEQLRGSADALDARSDVFSLGATLFEALTLSPAFPGDTFQDVASRIEKHDPRPPSKINRKLSRDVDAIILRALEKNPANRYGTAGEFAQDLRSLLEHRPVVARPVGRFVRATRWCQRNPIAAGLFATIGVALVVVSVFANQAAQSATVAGQRLVQFQAVKVVRDVRLLEHALDNAPGPHPRNAERLNRVHERFAELKGRLPGLIEIRDELATRGTLASAADPDRLLSVHPAAPHLHILESGRSILAGRAERDHLRGAWGEIVATRLHAMDLEIAEVRARVNARRGLAFEDAEDEYLFDTLEDQIERIEWLVERRLPELTDRVRWASELVAAQAATHQESWERDAAMVQLPPYQPSIEPSGLAQIHHLVPLGPDLDSGLLEYAYPRSGVIPKRDDDGALQIDGESAMVFVLLPGANTLIGAQRKDPDEPHYDKFSGGGESIASVRLDPFLIAKFEVTHAQWDRLAEPLLKDHHAHFFYGAKGWELKPIINVSWFVCSQICTAHGLELPTEAQWEYACRGNTQTPWWCGADVLTLNGRENVLDEDQPRSGHAPFSDGWFGRLPVTDRRPNPFGLYHMHGNVQEWCRDPWVRSDGIMRDGDGLRSGGTEPESRAVRGGFYMGPYTYSRSSKRMSAGMNDRKQIMGLRPGIPLLSTNEPLRKR